MKNLLLFLSLFILALSSCEEISPVLDNELQAEVAPRAAEDDCVFNDFVNQVRIFDICGVELVFQGELRLMNNGNIHRIKASGKCHKSGNPDALVKVTEIAVEIWGEASIWCDIPIDITEPSDYNTNLVNGEVSAAEHCHNCNTEIVNINYAKHVTVADDDIIKAKIRLKLDVCGEFYEETIFLDIQP